MHLTRLFAPACFLLTVGAVSAQAQSSAPDFPATPAAAPAAPAPANPRLSPAAKAREERRARMSPEEARRDQQMEILEARAGGGTSNTTFGRQASQSRQYEGGAGGFKVKKFKDKRPGNKAFKRGQPRPAGGIDPKGKPLRHNNRGRNHFGIF